LILTPVTVRNHWTVTLRVGATPADLAVTTLGDGRDARAGPEGAMPALPKRNPARRNRSSTHATLSIEPHDVKVPELPPAVDGWHPMTVAWWADVWASPMAPEYHESDRHGLFLLAALVDSFWRSPTQALAAEIRLQRQSYGLTPLDRRRLQWEIERTDEAQDKGAKRRAAPATAAKAPTVKNDPRAALSAVA
jgi:hypothetical protein